MDYTTYVTIICYYVLIIAINLLQKPKRLYAIIALSQKKTIIALIAL
jgi:hypothetical protein